MLVGKSKSAGRAIILILLFIGIWMSVNADTVQIGDGNILNLGLPFEPFNAFSYSQQLFLPSEIGLMGTITEISFQYQVASSTFLYMNQAIRLYMGHSDRTLMSEWFPYDSLQVVFDSNLLTEYFSNGIPGSGWLTIPLQTPFYFNGVSSLIIACDENSVGSSNSSDDFLATNTTATRAILFKSSVINPDPANPPDYDLYFRNARSNLRLEIEAVHYTPFNPSPVNGAQNVSHLVPALSWQSDAQSFDVFFGHQPDAMAQLISNGTGHSLELGQNLQMLSTYYWKVVAHAEGDTYQGNLWSFTTGGEVLSPPRNLVAQYQYGSIHLSWQPPLTGTIVEYEIMRNNQPLGRTPLLSYLDHDLVPGTTYYYFVRGINYLNQVSPASNLVSVTVPYVIDNLILWQGFEELAAFETDIPRWQNLDLDGSETWEWENISFPGEGFAMGWMVFDPSQTTPPLTGLSAFEGNKMLMSMSSLNPPNNDLLILPPCYLGTSPMLRFYARSYTADYGLERLRVLISTTGSDPDSFVPLSGATYISVPAEWTHYSYDLGAYQSSSVYLALQCVSWDAFALFVDAIELVGEDGYVSIDEHVLPPPKVIVYPNPNRGEFVVKVSDKSKYRLSMYDLRGRKIYQTEVSGSFDSSSMMPSLGAGIYLLKIGNDSSFTTKKVFIRK